MNRGDGETDRRRRFGDLCESLRPDLLRFAWWLGRDRGLAEDVVQESMLRAWKSFDALADERKAKAWLLTIVRREFARSFEKKRLELSDVDSLVAAESAVLAAPEDERVSQMREEIFRLDAEYREPLVLQVLMGYSTQEIADTVRACVTPDTFAKRYSLMFRLLADTTGAVATSYGSLYNLGLFKLAKRNTFLIDPEGRIAKVYAPANAARNSQEVIVELKKLKGV